jgi:hypothetical protein
MNHASTLDARQAIYHQSPYRERKAVPGCKQAFFIRRTRRNTKKNWCTSKATKGGY